MFFFFNVLHSVKLVGKVGLYRCGIFLTF